MSRLGVCLWLLAAATAPAAQDIGFEGPQFSPTTSSPTESKPENKLWFNDGIWWGSLWSASAAAFRIHRLDFATHEWTDTGVAVDSRANSRSDALWDGTKLYLASHKFASSGGTSGFPILFFRYGYDPLTDTYSLDPGFPVTIGSSSTEGLTIEKDSTGTIWAVWTQGLRIRVAHTLGSDAVWSAPVVLPANGTDFTSDDVCGIVHFNGDRIGVLWSDQVLNAFRFSVHLDGAVDSAWSAPENATSGESDDHLNLAAHSDGRVFFAGKNAANNVLLVVRAPDGTWSRYVVSEPSPILTRPIVLLNEPANTLHIFATGQTTGEVFEKTSPIDAIAFGPGRGTIRMRDSSTVYRISDPTSTRQNVDSSTGLVVLAHHDTTGFYWHHEVPPSTGAPLPAFTAAPTNGPFPLAVVFTNASTGDITSYSWAFGDGGTSSAASPSHTYTAAGTYTVSLTAAGPGGAATATKAGLIRVDVPPSTRTFVPVADAPVNETMPSSNFGSSTALRVKGQSGSSYQSFLRFDLSSLGGTVTSARLRLFCTDGSNNGGQWVAGVSNAWSETGITWASKPALPAPFAPLGAVTPGTWFEVDVSPAVTAPGLYSFALNGGSTDSAVYSSREGANPPQLVVATGAALQADFAASPLSGPAPLQVTFLDSSTGAPTGWSWSFGDGGTSSEQNPVHAYTSPGTFTVALTATNAAGSSTVTRTDLVSAWGTPTVRTLVAAADARVNEANPTQNAGTATILRVRSAPGGSYHTYLRFDLTGVSAPITSARLRLFCTDESPDGGVVFPTASTWTETGVTWANGPAATGGMVASLGPVTAGSWVEVEVGAAALPGSPLDLLLTSGSSNSAYYSSREGVHPLELVLTTSGP